MDQDTNDDGRHQRRLRAAERLADQAFEARLGTMCKAGQSRRDRCLAVALRCDVGRLKGGGDSSPPEAMPLLRLSLLSSPPTPGCRHSIAQPGVPRGDILLAHGVCARPPLVILTGTSGTDAAMSSNTWPTLAGCARASRPFALWPTRVLT